MQCQLTMFYKSRNIFFLHAGSNELTLFLCEILAGRTSKIIRCFKVLFANAIFFCASITSRASRMFIKFGTNGWSTKFCTI